MGDLSHSARKSDHNPAPPNGIVRAIDVDKDGMDARALIACAIQDVRVEYVIHAGLIYQRRHGFKPRTYTGVNAHHGHVHISVRHHATLETSTAPWALAAVAASPIGGGAGLAPRPTLAAPIIATPPASEEDPAMPHYLRVIDGSTDKRHKAGDIWEVGEFTADRLDFQSYTDLQTTIDPRLKGATAAAIDRLVARTTARRLHVHGPDKKGK